MINIKRNIIPILAVVLSFVCIFVSSFQAKNYYDTSCKHIKETYGDKISVEELNSYCITSRDGNTLFKEITSKEIDNNIMNYSEIFLPIIICLICIYPVYSMYKSGFIKNILVRKKYKFFIKSVEIKTILCNLLFPLLLVLLLVLSYLFTGSFDFEKTRILIGDTSAVEALIPFSNNFFLYYSLIFLKVYFFCILFSNIGLFFIKKLNNFILIMISTFISYLVLCFISEIFISGIIVNVILKLNLGYAFNIMDLLNNSNFKELIISTIFIFILMNISIFINYLSYRSKENVIISREKI